jgi:hypothetical protein
MLHHAANTAAQPNLRPNAFSAPRASRKERNAGGETPSFLRAFASNWKLRFGRTSAAEPRRVTSIHWASSVPYPVFCSGSRFGAIRRPAALGLLLRFRHPSRSTPDLPGTRDFSALAGLGSSQNKFVSRGTERRTNFFRAPPRKQTCGTWEPGPLAWLRLV